MTFIEHIHADLAECEKIIALGVARPGTAEQVEIIRALLASFPARNSDLWPHLAAGRRLARGEWPPDARAASSWLYDLVCYGSKPMVDFKPG